MDLLQNSAGGVSPSWLMVRDRVVETLSQVWKTCILTVIRIPQTVEIISVIGVTSKLVDDADMSTDAVEPLRQVFVATVDRVNVSEGRYTRCS